MKKYSLTLIVLAMLLALFGCSNKPPKDETSVKPTATVQEAEQEANTKAAKEPKTEPLEAFAEIQNEPAEKPAEIPTAVSKTEEKPAANSSQQVKTTPQPTKPPLSNTQHSQTTEPEPQKPSESDTQKEPTPSPKPEPKPESEPELEPEPNPEPEKKTIDVGALASSGRSYASSLGFIVDTSLGFSNAGYFPGDKVPLESMSEGYRIVKGNVYGTYQELMAADGNIDGAACNVLVTDDGGGMYTIWVFYG